MNCSWLMPAAAFLPLVCGTVLLAGRKKTQSGKNFALVSIVLCAIVSVLAFFSSGSSTLISFAENMPLVFRTDSMSVLFGGLTTAMWLCAALFSREYMSHEEHQTDYYAFFLMSYGSLMGICFSGNLISLYMFYELMTVATIPLVLHTRERAAISAALKYMIYSIGGALLSLFGLFLLGKYSGAEFTFMGMMTDADFGTKGLIAAMFCIFGFGTKAGMFPMHGWLPTAHPVAPSPASALLSGNVTKMGVLAIVRVLWYVIGPEKVAGTWVQYTFIALSLITVFMGSMMAYKERILKKRLAYSTVSQVSYILFGIALLNTTALYGAMLHVIFHSVIKNALFYSAGIIIMKTGKKKVSELTGIGKLMPKTMLMYSVAALALVGIPPLSGFYSKWKLCLGSLYSGISVVSWLGPVVLLISALLTAGYLFPVSVNGFFPGKDFEKDIQNEENSSGSKAGTAVKADPNKVTLFALLVLTVLTIVFGFFPELPV